MPTVSSSQPSAPVSSGRRQGMLISEIIEQANKKTERLGEKTLDMRSELLGVVQDLVNHTRWHWAKKSKSVTLSSGESGFDMTDPDGANIQDFGQIAQTGLKLFLADQLIGTVVPEFDTEKQEIMRETVNTGKPSRYFIYGGAILYFDCIPDASYTLRLPYWAIPNQFEADTDDVPLVPAYLHKTLQKGLEAEVFRYALGEGNAKYSATLAEYERMKERFAKKKNFAPGETEEWRNFSSNDAIQSTR